MKEAHDQHPTAEKALQEVWGTLAPLLTSPVTLYFFKTMPVSQSTRHTESPPQVAAVLDELTTGSER